MFPFAELIKKTQFPKFMLDFDGFHAHGYHFCKESERICRILYGFNANRFLSLMIWLFPVNFQPRLSKAHAMADLPLTM